MQTDILIEKSTMIGQGIYISSNGIPFLYYYAYSSTKHILTQDQAAFMIYFDGENFRAYCPHYGNYVDLSGNIGLCFNLSEGRFPKKLTTGLFQSVKFKTANEYELFRTATNQNWLEPCKFACFKDFESAIMITYKVPKTTLC